MSVPLVARTTGRASLQSLFSQKYGEKVIKMPDSCTRLPFPDAESRSRLVPANDRSCFSPLKVCSFECGFTLTTLLNVSIWESSCMKLEGTLAAA